MKKRIRILVSVSLVFVILAMLQRLVMPKYMVKIVEGSMVESYYEEKTKHDVLFVGDCEVYETFTPIELYRDYGITSFIRGSAQQLIWHSYYLLEEMLEREKPKVVIFNVLSMKYDKPQREAYNRMTIDGMKWSKHKINMIKASMMPDEKFVDYVFPILRYHSRILDLEEQDFKYFWGKRKIFHNGYYMRVDKVPVTSIPKPSALEKSDFEPNVYEYLDKIRELTEKNGAELVLMKAPSVYPHWYPQWDKRIKEYASKHNLHYFNFLDENLKEEVGTDYNTDTYDGGLHMNLYGAEKLSVFMGKFLKNNFDIPDRRKSDISEVWDEKVKFYDEFKKQQYKDLENYGVIKSYD